MVFWKTSLSLRLIGVVESKKALRRRIKHMLNRPIPKSAKVGLAGVLAVIVAGAILLPMAKAQKMNKGNMPVAGRTDRATSGVRIRKVLVRGESAYAGIQETRQGKVSPDGRHFSFTDWRSNTGSSWLRIRDLRTGEIRDITKPPTDKDQSALNSIWSPDGKQIAYKLMVRRLRPPRRPNYHDEIRIVGLDGSEPRLIVEGDEGQEISVYDWSSDGKHLVGTAGKDIVMISVEDGSMRVLKTFGHDLEGMRISPDGRFIVYAYAPNEDDPFQRDIFLLATDGSHDSPLIEHPSHDYEPVWTPDGKGIVFVSNRTGTTGIWMLKVVNGQPRGRPKLIKQTTGLIHAKGFTQDGSYYYEVMLGEHDIYVATLDPETGGLLGASTKLKLPYEGWNRAPAWSPDGQYIAYISRHDFTRSAGDDFPPVLTLYSVNSGKVRELSPEPPFQLIQLNPGPQWSPDGRSLLVSGLDSSKKHVGIYLIDIRTNKTTLIVSPKSEEERIGGAVWTPDGKAFIYNQFILDKGRTVPVLLRNLETGQEKELWREVVGWNRPVAVSPDGQQVAILEWAPWEAWGHLRRFLRIVPISGGEARDLIRFQKWANTGKGSLSWTPDGRYILFAKRRQGSGPVLYRIPSEGGKPQELDVVTQTDSGKFSLHPDGKRIAFTGPGRGTELWVMDNFLPD
jgi:Tol biopolymer transport system component